MITVCGQKLFSKGEVCDMFKICGDTLDSYIRRKRIRATKIGWTAYISEEALRAFLGLNERAIDNPGRLSEFL
jgi:hypothetical protein